MDVVNRLIITSFILLIFSCNSELAKLNRISKRLPFLTQLGSITQGYLDANGSDDSCRRIVVDRFENIICTGYSTGVFGGSYKGGRDLIVTKFDRHGNLLWTYQDGLSSNEEGRDLVVDENGNIFVIATIRANSTDPFSSTQGAIALIRLSPDGQEIGFKRFDSSPTAATPAVTDPSDSAHSILRDRAGNFFISGNTRGNFSSGENAGNNDAFILKFDSQGTILARYQIGTSANDSCFDIALSPDEKFIYCAGRTNGSLADDNGGGFDAFVLRLDAETLTNEIITQYGKKTLGDSTCGVSGSNTTEADFDDELFEIKTGSSGRVYAVGQTYGRLGGRSKGTNGIHSNGLILSLDQELNRKACDLIESNGNDRIYDFVIPKDQLLIYAGVTDRNLFEIPTGLNNLFLRKQSSFQRQFGQITAPGQDSVCQGVALDSDENVYCIGRTSTSLAEPNAGNADIFLLRLFPDGSGR